MSVDARIQNVFTRTIFAMNSRDRIMAIPARAIPVHSRRWLWKFGYQFLKLGFGPGSGGAGPHIPERADRECEFGDVVSVRGVDKDNKIAVAGRQIDLLDFHSDLLAEVSRSLAALREILTERMPWSVQLSDNMNVGMGPSCSRKNRRSRGVVVREAVLMVSHGYFRRCESF